ncbi:PREDICTED: uncharacterized protein LOC105116261 isoform X2 [Populus euphratica]|uniref:Uncharacterized protein LOC105116261 isoform X2 n=1 Tax=Populus euphratica TaxID=75702 RepID=A0AAJ6TJU4_POPEU|nr:PREDICTED: uncharacterized protein LOC105116261 isoform X2 [Populus euphratica]
MGTKLEYAINLLATSQNSSSVGVRCVDDLEYLQTRGLSKDLQVGGTDKFCSSMDRMPEKHNIDVIKKTMQLHDDIFKQQVRELHRLYSVQKMLMDELSKNEIKQNRKCWTPMTSSYINYSQFANRPNSTAQTTCGYSFLFQSPRDDPSSRERSGSCSDETVRFTRGFDLERLAEHISTGVGAVDENQAGPSTCAPQKGKMSIDGSDEDSEVELTLSIGGTATSKKISKSYQTLELDSPASFKSERREDYSTPITPMSSSTATCGQDRKRPHWLFQKV